MGTLQKVESLAETLYGRASSVSVDVEGDWKIVRVWNSAGFEVEEVRVTSTKTAAIKAMRETLAYKVARRERGERL